MNIRYSKSWSTHNTMLFKTVTQTKGEVLEIGAGLFSTPLLHWLCKEYNLRLTTLESNPDFFKFAKQFQSSMHHIRLVDNVDDYKLNKHWGVVFVDHDFSNQLRGNDAIAFKNNADFVVMHDTEAEEKYGYDKVWGHYKYRYDWKECRPWTSVVSNFKDLSFLNKKVND